MALLDSSSYPELIAGFLSRFSTWAGFFYAFLLIGTLIDGIHFANLSTICLLFSFFLFGVAFASLYAHNVGIANAFHEELQTDPYRSTDLADEVRFNIDSLFCLELFFVCFPLLICLIFSLFGVPQWGAALAASLFGLLRMVCANTKLHGKWVGWDTDWTFFDSAF